MTDLPDDPDRFHVLKTLGEVDRLRAENARLRAVADAARDVLDGWKVLRASDGQPYLARSDPDADEQRLRDALAALDQGDDR